MNQTIAILGCGHMGELILQQLKKTWPQNKFVITRRDKKKLRQIAKKYQVSSTTDNANAVSQADIIWLCVRPSEIVNVIQEIKPSVKKEAIIISVAAAISSTFIGHYFPKQTVIWYMPSPLLNERKSVAVMSSNTKNKTVANWKKTFKKWSTLLLEIPESEIHLFTTIASCSSAFFAGILDQMVQASALFSPRQQKQIEKVLLTVAADTFASLQRKPYQAVHDLIQHVQTKGGLTQAGFTALQTKQAKKVFFEMIKRAVKRSEKRAALTR